MWSGVEDHLLFLSEVMDLLSAIPFMVSEVKVTKFLIEIQLGFPLLSRHAPSLKLGAQLVSIWTLLCS